MTTKKSCYLFDIDGTLADCSRRLHHIQKTTKDWGAFFSECHLDVPYDHIIGLAQDLLIGGDGDRGLVFVSERSDQCRHQTEKWLRKQGLPDGPLYMRRAGDHRPDNQIKIELLNQLRADGYTPIMAFDDRNEVVEAWRAAGVPCAQVAHGNF